MHNDVLTIQKSYWEVLGPGRARGLLDVQGIEVVPVLPAYLERPLEIRLLPAYLERPLEIRRASGQRRVRSSVT